MFRLKQDHGSRRVYSTGRGTLTVEVTETEHAGIKGGAMDVYVRNGWVPRFMDRTLGVQTYLRLPDGTQVGELFNPTVAPGAREVDFDWLLEATPENERLLLEEVERRFLEWAMAVSSEAIALGTDVNDR